MAKGIFLRHVGMALLCSAVSVILLYMGGASAKNPYVEPVFVASLIMFLANSVFINRGLFRGINSSGLRYSLIAVLSGVFTLIYFFLTLVVIVNVHLALGGSS